MKEPIPYEFGVTGHWREDFDIKASHIKRLKKLYALEESDLITKVCKHYISHFIPNPVTEERRYWIITCFPSTDKSPIRISIWFPEVFNIHQSGHYYNYSGELSCMIFVHTDYFDTPFKQHLKEEIPGLHFSTGYRFRTGIEKQLAVFMPLSSYFDFIKNDVVYESIRVHNYELTLKGKSPFRGHNYALVRTLFGALSFLED